MNDNAFAIAQWQNSGNVMALRRHVAHPAFVADDDEGWTLVALAGSVRPCQCGSDISWHMCHDPLGNHCCG